MIQPTAQRGALLIELLIGTAIIAAGVLTIYLGLTSLTKLSSQTSQRARAMTQLTSHLDTIRATEFTALTPGIVAIPINDLPDGQQTTTITVLEPSLIEVVLLLTWTSTEGEGRNASIVTRITDDGLESL